MAKNKNREIIELEIESIGFEGISIARREGRVYFVDNAVPKDKVRAAVLRKRKSYIETKLVEVVESSPNRIGPKCRYFSDCGGCSWQNLEYSEQLLWKRQHVCDAFERIGRLQNIKIEQTLESELQFNFRNKMEFSFSDSRWLTQNEIQSDEEYFDRNFALGLHAPQRYDKVIDISECFIHPEINNTFLCEFREAALRLRVTPYSQRTRSGFLKNLIIRHSLYYHEIMVILLTTLPRFEQDELYLSWLKDEFIPKHTEVSTFIHAVNDTVSPVAVGEPEIISGSGFITESILGIDFRISPFSFFQTNSSQLDTFISKILEIAELKQDDVIWDLYCGAGSISLPASKLCNFVYGLELSETSVADAISNARLNNIENIRFEARDLHGKDFQTILESLPKPDVIILDPPRAGMNKNLVNYLIESGVRKIIYVSCNPATQARDCALLSERYTIEFVQPVDMFPQTYHVESIARMLRK
ncbi:MAG: rRNA (uracil1939-C5)-methyltransferase [Bacteroidota bacterium]|nr:rRNA (uracil1939-C5)-methyltransferase [Bacteroidota bacterium]